MPITALPTPPTRADSANFATRADAFVAALPAFATEANALQAAVNAAEATTVANADAAADARTAAESARDVAQGAANYKGLWSGLAGALNIPASTYHLGEFWVLTQNVANVTTKEPGTAPEWVRATTTRRMRIFSADTLGLAASSTAEETVDGIPATGLNTTLAGLCFGDGLFVASANSNSANVATSPDGLTWTLRSMPSSAGWRPAHNGSSFLASAAGSTAIALSADGVTWSSGTALPGTAVGNSPPVYVGGLWLVYNIGTTAYTSADGAAWTTRTLPAAPAGGVIMQVGGVLWFYVSSTSAYTSADGINWTARTLPAAFTQRWQDFDGALLGFVVGGNYHRSTDGINWTDLGFGSADGSSTRAYSINGVWLMPSTTFGNCYTRHSDAGWVLRISRANAGICVRDTGATVYLFVSSAVSGAVARITPASSVNTALFGT